MFCVFAHLFFQCDRVPIFSQLWWRCVSCWNRCDAVHSPSSDDSQLRDSASLFRFHFIFQLATTFMFEISFNNINHFGFSQSILWICATADSVAVLLFIPWVKQLKHDHLEIRTKLRDAFQMISCSMLFFQFHTFFFYSFRLLYFRWEKISGRWQRVKFVYPILILVVKIERYMWVFHRHKWLCALVPL